MFKHSKLIAYGKCKCAAASAFTENYRYNGGFQRHKLGNILCYSLALTSFFGFNSAALSNEAKASLRELAQILKEDPTTDIAIIGHTDKVGTYEANMKVSKNRAYAVENYLQDCGVSPAQFKKVEGVGYNEYDESLSADQNRRVEVYMYASEQMIKNAEAGQS